jgi:hypothetical protein
MLKQILGESRRCKGLMEALFAGEREERGSLSLIDKMSVCSVHLVVDDSKTIVVRSQLARA